MTMNVILSKAKTVWLLLTHANLKLLVRVFKKRMYSQSMAYGLLRDLNVACDPPPANMPLTIRPFKHEDVAALLDLKTPGIGMEGIQDRLSRQQLLRSGIPQCYVATNDAGTPCYMQWLFSADHNKQIQKYYRGYFPVLNSGEALLEGAFTPESFRGCRIMPCAMAQIAEQARNLRARSVLTFVNDDNLASLKGCTRAGFSVLLMRSERWRFFRRSVSFTPLPANTPYPFDLVSEAPRARRSKSAKQRV
jgi:hypothetical protein